MNKNKRIIILSVVAIVVVAGGFTISNNSIKKSIKTHLTNVLLPNAKDFYKVGETVKINDMYMAIDKIKISNGTRSSRPDEGKEYLIVTVTVKNGSNSKRKYGDDFQLQDAKGQVNDSLVTMMDANQTFRGGDLAPKGEVTGTMTFLSVKGATGLSLNYKGEIFGNNIVHFKLN